MAFDYQCEDRCEGVVFRLNGQIGLEETARLRKVFWNALHDALPSRFVIDFAGVSSFDATAISLLVTTRNWAGKLQADFILTNLSGHARQFLERNHLDQYFVLAPDPETALVMELDGTACYSRPADQARRAG